MRSSLLLSILLGCCQTIPLFAQKDYSTYYQEMNPAFGRDLSPKEQISLLEGFLETALHRQDTIPIIHGYMYLANAYYLQSELEMSLNYLLEAEQLAERQNNKLLLGRIYHKKGGMYTTLLNYPKAVELFNNALEFSGAAKDSQYLAITYEQLGAVHGYQEKFELANQYYELAIPLVEQYGDDYQLAATFANYGIVLSDLGQSEGAIEYYQKAIELNKKTDDLYQSVPCSQNLALEYQKIDKLADALNLYYHCLNLNLENGWNEFLIYNYRGLASVHQALGHLDSALYYQKAYHNLNDSIIGAEVQTKIGSLEAEVELKEKELQVLQQKEAVEAQRQKTRKIVVVALFLLSFAAMGLWILILQKRKNELRLREHRESLIQLTKILQAKNSELRDLKVAPNDHRNVDGEAGDGEDQPVINPYDIKILTPDDWLSFKELFEKSYPGFLLHFRSAYPDMSEAEERLFLLLKLNLTSREIANTLGIQPDSVKKARTRLRKRLDLESTASLKEFIYKFN